MARGQACDDPEGVVLLWWSLSISRRWESAAWGTSEQGSSVVLRDLVGPWFSRYRSFGIPGTTSLGVC